MAANDSSDQLQRGKSLKENMEYMLEHKKSCDITCRLGKERIEIKAHKIVLVARSSYFFEKITCQNIKEIDIVEIDADIFKVILKYIYTDDTSQLTDGNVGSVLEAAKHLRLHFFYQKCVLYLDSGISTENVCLFHESAHTCEEIKLKTKCFDFILKNPKKSLENAQFQKLCQDCIGNIISSDKLILREERIFEMVLSWSQQQCKVKQLEAKDENIRYILIKGNLLYKIRFPLISVEYFTKYIENRSILSSSEIQEVLSGKSLSFCQQKRYGIKKTYDEKIIRFKRNREPDETSCKWSFGPEPDSICFQVTEDAHLHGVSLYGSKHGLNEHNVTLSIINDQKSVITVLKTQYKADVLSDILFLSDPIFINKTRRYEIQALIKGRNSCFGEWGEETMSFKNMDANITFYQSTGPSNGTNVECGQIPGLLFSSIYDD